ncbi:hypothetical protein DFH94DRAFT_769242 [Russula ochroleuca]|uniref:Uncharacterized protein n=1 Tax=Russula ochroleuca TaxID=152965 RepID=A0A9P5JY98_9AGAM|nr:hypothetical protein DFH94DRAFT_769242 [Russula ochroleuca]
MNSVQCGMKMPSVHVTGDHIAFLPWCSVKFATFTSPYIKTAMLPRHYSLLPPTASTLFYLSHRRIRCVTSPVIARIRSLIFLFRFSPHLLIHSILTALPMPVAPFYEKQRSSQDPPFHLIRRHLAKSETALGLLQSLHSLYQFTPVDVPQMHHHQAL